MRTTKQFLAACSPVLIAFATALTLSGAEKVDLDRDTPVPASEPIPVQDFFRQPSFRGPVVNPSGTYVAAIVSAGADSSALMVYNLETSQIETAGGRDVDSDVSWVNWMGDDRIGFLITLMKQSGGLLFGAAKVGSLQASAHPILEGVGGYLVTVPPGDREHPLINLFPHGYLTGRYGQVVSVNAALDSGSVLDLSTLTDGKNMEAAEEASLRHVSKRYPVLETPDGFQLDYFADKDGNLEFGVTSTNGVLALHQLVGDHWQRCPEDLDEMTIVGAGNNPGEVVVLGPRADNKPRPLEVLKASSGEVVELLAQDKAYDADAWLYRDPVSHDIVGAVFDRTGPHVVWFSEVYRNLQKMVDELFPGQVVRIIGNDEKGRMALIETWSDRQPAFYHWVNLQKRSVRDLKRAQPWLDPARMRPMSAIKYRTRDGRELDAYVVMPAGASKKNPPPLVVIPPSGTWSRYTWGFNDEAQFLASRGYAVLLPNHRGSSGTTWMFPTEDEWAYRKMSDDVTEATKALAATGYVDPKRVAIMGTDFGGFLALSGAAYSPSLYRCAIGISAVTDWGKFVADYKVNKYSSAYFSRMVYKLGDPEKDPEKWDAIAPLRHAADIRAAVLISTSEYDSPLVITGSKELASAVERNHLPVETVSYINEGVGVHHLRNKVDLYTRIADFLARNLGPAP